MVTRRVERYVQERFDASEAELVLAALGEWRISYEEDPPSERLIAAVVLAADGRLDGVDAAFRTAEQDWRDLLERGGKMKRCEEKIRYGTAAGAKWSLWGIWFDRYLRGRRRRRERRAYACPHCGGWHLTSQAKRRR